MAVMTKKSALKNLSPLTGGEILNVVLQGGFAGGAALCTTGDGKVHVTTYPTFGKPKLRYSVPFEQITLFDFAFVSNKAYVTVETADGNRELLKVSVSPFMDQADELFQIWQDVTMVNPSARAGYLNGEDLLAAFYASKSSIKLTSGRLLFCSVDGKSGQVTVEREVPVEQISAVDFYPGKMSTGIICLRSGNNDVQLLSTGNNMFGTHGGEQGSIFDKGGIVAHFYHQLTRLHPAAAPGYLEEGEQEVCTVRVGHSQMSGSVMGKHILRLTDRRLLELTPEKDGTLRLELALSPEEIDEAVVKRISRQSNVVYQLKVTAQGEKYKFVVDREYEERIRQIQAALQER